jgi:predicted phage tail protein
MRRKSWSNIRLAAAILAFAADLFTPNWMSAALVSALVGVLVVLGVGMRRRMV